MIKLINDYCALSCSSYRGKNSKKAKFINKLPCTVKSILRQGLELCYPGFGNFRKLSPFCISFFPVLPTNFWDGNQKLAT